jgi:hypothetical protein
MTEVGPVKQFLGGPAAWNSVPGRLARRTGRRTDQPPTVYWATAVVAPVNVKVIAF